MNLPSIIEQSWLVDRLGWMLLHSLWETTVLGVLAAFVFGAFRSSTAVVRYRLACASLLAVAAEPGIRRAARRAFCPSCANLANRADIHLNPSAPARY